MKLFHNIIQKNFLLIVIFAALLLSLLIPQLGIFFNKIFPKSILIFWIFICQGLSIITKDFKKFSHYLPILVLGLAISQCLSPVLGYSVARLFSLQGDEFTGIILISCMAPTLISGTLIAEEAGGDKTTSILLTIFINLAAIAVIPFSLKWALGKSIELDSFSLFYKLLLLVLLPAFIGFCIRKRKNDSIKKFSFFYKNSSILALGLIIFCSLSKQAEHLMDLRFMYILKIITISLIIHLSLFLIGYLLSKYLLKSTESSYKSMTICCSQKTLPIVIVIWSSFFAEHFPMAIIPPVIFHISQIYMDTFIASKWKKS